MRVGCTGPSGTCPGDRRITAAESFCVTEIVPEMLARALSDSPPPLYPESDRCPIHDDIHLCIG
jgi:hypothetical protein